MGAVPMITAYGRVAGSWRRLLLLLLPRPAPPVLRPGSICQAIAPVGWGRGGAGAEELFLWRPRARGWREGSGMGGAWRGRRDRRPAKVAVRGTPWRREGDGVGARGSPSGCGQGRGQRRGATRQPVHSTAEL
jgi:hypothetical protein